MNAAHAQAVADIEQTMLAYQEMLVRSRKLPEHLQIACDTAAIYARWEAAIRYLDDDFEVKNIFVLPFSIQDDWPTMKYAERREQLMKAALRAIYKD